MSLNITPAYSQLFPDNVNLLGSTVKAQTTICALWEATGTTTLTSGQIRFIAVYLPVGALITGVKFGQSIQGVYTSSAVNAIAMYSHSAGTLTKQVETANTGTLWKATANSIVTTAFSSTYQAPAGIYFLAFLYSSSAQTTAPTILAAGAGPVADFGFTNSAFLSGVLNSQTTNPSTQASSGVTTSGTRPWGAIY